MHTSRKLLELSRKEKNPKKRIRLLAVSHVMDGVSRYKVADSLKVSRRSVNVWVSRYLEFGLSGLEAKKQKGREAYLSSEQQKQLSDFIIEKSQSPEGGRLTGQAIVDYIQVEFGVSYHLNSIYTLLKSLGFSWITSRSKHPKQDVQAQETFKKISN